MSKTGSAAKVKLNSFDDLFGTEQPLTKSIFFISIPATDRNRAGTGNRIVRTA